MVDNSGVVVSLKTALNSTRVNLSSFKKRKDALESTGVGEKKKDGFTEEFEYLQQQVCGIVCCLSSYKWKLITYKHGINISYNL